MKWIFQKVPIGWLQGGLNIPWGLFDSSIITFRCK